MWISKKKWKVLEKRVADLEEQVQSQLTIEPKKLSESIQDVIRHRREANRDNAPKLS